MVPAPGSDSNECALSWLHALTLYIIASRPYLLAAAGLASVSLTILSPSGPHPHFALLYTPRHLLEKWRFILRCHE